jgi:hypothetical protein
LDVRIFDFKTLSPRRQKAEGRRQEAEGKRLLSWRQEALELEAGGKLIQYTSPIINLKSLQYGG